MKTNCAPKGIPLRNLGFWKPTSSWKIEIHERPIFNWSAGKVPCHTFSPANKSQAQLLETRPGRLPQSRQHPRRSFEGPPASHWRTKGARRSPAKLPPRTEGALDSHLAPLPMASPQPPQRRHHQNQEPEPEPEPEPPQPLAHSWPQPLASRPLAPWLVWLVQFRQSLRHPSAAIRSQQLY